MPAERIEIGAMEFDVLKREVTRAGERIDPTAKEFALLHLIATRQGEVLSRSLIASQVWDMNFDRQHLPRLFDLLYRPISVVKLSVTTIISQQPNDSFSTLNGRSPDRRPAAIPSDAAYYRSESACSIRRDL